MTPTAPTPPAAPAPARRLCSDGCGGVLTERSRAGKLRRYLRGHAPNFARALDASSLSKASIDAFWGQVRIADNGMCLEWGGPHTPSGYGMFTDMW
jgi:hypothetical protein